MAILQCEVTPGEALLTDGRKPKLQAHAGSARTEKPNNRRLLADLMRSSAPPPINTACIVIIVIIQIMLLLGTAVGHDQRTSRKARGSSAGSTAFGSLTIATGHSGSVVFINNVRHGVTTESGTLSLKRVKAGSYPVKVRTLSFKDWTGSVVIAPAASKRLNVTQIRTTDEALLHFQKGESLRDAGKNQEAVDEYKQALSLRPGFSEARLAAARGLIALQVFDEAEEHIIAALKNDRGPMAEAHTILANLRRHQGILDEAITEYQKAILLDPGNAGAAFNLAVALERAGRIDEAKASYARALELDPTFAAAAEGQRKLQH